MKNKYLVFISGIIFIISCFFLLECEVRINKKANSGNHQGFSSGDSKYRNVFGDTLLALGGFIKNARDSVETGLWEYIKQDTPLVLFGNFSEGLPVKEWQFVLDDGRRFASNWNIYNNNFAACRFSIPFDYEETKVDSTCFQLKTMNDSLGKISIVINVGKAISGNDKLVQFGIGTETGLVQQGFTYTKKVYEIRNSKATYFFTEFFMKRTGNKAIKYYNIYGNLPSKSRFVEFSLYHEGPKEELVKLIFDLMANHLYINNERFYNPYLGQNKN